MSGKNIREGYSYHTEKDIVDTVKPLLIKFNIWLDVIVESVKESNSKTIAKIDYIFYDLDSDDILRGSWEGSTYLLDKSGNVVQKAITGAIKGMLMKKFGITSNEEPEAEKRFEDNSGAFNTDLNEKLGKIK